MSFVKPCLWIALLGAAPSFAQEPQRPITVALLPLDSRPVCTQMPRMMAEIAGVRFLMPPAENLGRFTQAGDYGALTAWLYRSSDEADALIVSADMLCYGGLVPSRESGVTVKDAMERLAILKRIKTSHPNLPIFLFAGIMRAAPTATREAATWRLDLANYLYKKDKAAATGNKDAHAEAALHYTKIPKDALQKYLDTRHRNFKVLQAMLSLAQNKTVDFLIYGQDDAEPYGPQRLERKRLLEGIHKFGLDDRAMLSGGIDQIACTLLARVLSQDEGLTPTLQVVWADDNGKRDVPPNEGQTVERALYSQITACGGRIATPTEDSDFTLYVNTPKRSEKDFQKLKEQFTAEIEAGRRVALVDLNLKLGQGDEALIRYLLESRLGTRLMAYSGWNTASNTIGTAIPHAIVYAIARRDSHLKVADREMAQQLFLLTRFASEYGYDNYIRPLAYDFAKEDLKGAKEEISGEKLLQLQRFVDKHTRKMLETFFKLGFKGTVIPGGLDGYPQVLQDLADVRVSLPWPRAYEVSINFSFSTTPPVLEPPKEK